MRTSTKILLLRRAGRHNVNLSGQLSGGALLMGWGLFNLVEGVVDHHLLQLHHAYEPMGLSIRDYAFLLWSAAMAVGGWIVARRELKR
ncbi:DUF2243 domain-containing protein [Sphingomonas solaris]|uniref:DUF2243 domain-containing protein n=1 Tax=Alterirhizorhabdus solaris TaxID=2529389 RepID=A0A558QWX6_9SPHN|nr:DUF2243 domain-containing protein [Sphingomonas solaris]TVV71644.1 DUF2243 domain-containing protein [Sphingomonas solaris]